MAIANSVINGYKSVVDAAAILNEADIALASTFSLQHKCLFEMLIYPETFPKTPGGIALSVLDTIMMRVNLYAINDIPLTGFEYQRSGGRQFLKDLVYTDTFSCTFLENSFGNVKGYFRKWEEEIVTFSKGSSLGFKNLRGDYLFKDDQDASKKTAIIIPMQPDMLPSPEWIKIDGMKFKNVTGIGYDHASGENEIITAEFTCDNIRLSQGTSAL